MKIKKVLKCQGGFTLIEMLIVVAIIAILVAVSIPMVTTSLEKASESTDLANIRAAKAAILLDYTNYISGATSVLTYTAGSTVTGNYDADTGKIVAAGTVPTVKYGKSTKKVDGATGDSPKGKYLQISFVVDTQTITMEWK